MQPLTNGANTSDWLEATKEMIISAHVDESHESSAPVSTLGELGASVEDINTSKIEKNET